MLETPWAYAQRLELPSVPTFGLTSIYSVYYPDYRSSGRAYNIIPRHVFRRGIEPPQPKSPINGTAVAGPATSRAFMYASMGFYGLSYDWGGSERKRKIK